MTKTKIICSKASTCKAAKNCDHAKPHKGPCGPATQCHSDPDNEISTCIAVGGDINVDGFYAGKKAFNLILEAIGEDTNSDIKEIEYNGFTIKLNPASEDTTVMGVGWPYADIARKFELYFKNKGNGE